MNPRRRFLHYAVAGLASGCSVALASAPARVYRVGYLSARATHSAVDDAFAGGMRELGYTIGHNLLIEYRWAGNDAKRLGPLADELVRLNVDIIVTATTAGTRAAMRATRTIPIVMAASADPVRAGLVASLGRPGGNVTGISLQTTDVAQKRLQLLREIVPGARRIALLAERLSDPSQGTTGLFLAETQAAAETVGADLVARQIAHAGELAEAFEYYRRERAQALIVQVSPLLLEHRFTITGSAAQARLPAMYETRDFVEAGGLVAYGPDLRANYRRAAAYVDRIFKGANPGNLPVEQPAKLELIVNLKAANAMGLTIPQSVLVQASEVT